jgi:hypothetical protein
MLKKAFTGMAALFVLLTFALHASSASAFRLEKDVPYSQVPSRPLPIEVHIYASAGASSPVVSQTFSVGALTIARYSTFSGEGAYRISMDFTETAALTSAMELWWEFTMNGTVIGKREPVPGSAWALFSAEAMTAGTAGHAATAGDADTLDGRHAADLDTLYVNENQAGASGVRTCSGGAWGPCENQVVPVAETCDNTDDDCDGVVDNNGLACFDAAAGSAQIAAVQSAADGAVSLPVTGYVTFVKSEDGAGFFVQAESAGPALYVAEDPFSLTPVPVPGDVVSFTVTLKQTLNGLRQARTIAGYTRIRGGFSVSSFVQDVSSATDLVSALDSYESELITLAGTVAGPFTPSGIDFFDAPIDTAGITGDANLTLRVSRSVKSIFGLTEGCAFTIDGTPLWRNLGEAQASAWNNTHIIVHSCPAPQVLRAAATSPTNVRVFFNRNILPGSVVTPSLQFVFAGDSPILATGASVSGMTIDVAVFHNPDASYTVSVADTVQDIFGTGVDQTANTAAFTGYNASFSGLVINEVDYDQPAADVAEFVEIYNAGASTASLDGVALVAVSGSTNQEHGSRAYLFDAGSLAPGDYLVVGPAGYAITDIPFAAASNNLLNGSPNGVALVHEPTSTLIDALSYEGEITAATITGFASPVNLVEGTAVSASDAAADGSLVRCPNGSDTDDADTDWVFTPTLTPGAANSCP